MAWHGMGKRGRVRTGVGAGSEMRGLPWMGGWADRQEDPRCSVICFVLFCFVLGETRDEGSVSRASEEEVDGIAWRQRSILLATSCLFFFLLSSHFFCGSVPFSPCASATALAALPIPRPQTPETNPSLALAVLASLI